MVATVWLLMHGYHGLTGDAQIYAFQALARIHPSLAADLYLQNRSQDQFTIFSPFYAWFVRGLGLEGAARLLTVFFTAALLAGAWSFARAVTRRDAAWLAVAFLLIVPGDYGGSGVFRLWEPFLTARLPAEAMIVWALACYARGMRHMGLMLAIAALFVHPLVALPGLLLLACLWLPIRLSILGALAAVSVVLGLAAAAAGVPAVSQLFKIMDAAWLDVVRERSQFLFLQLWSAHDWEVNTRPFLYLGFTAIAVLDPRIRKLCMAAALVGAAGLAVALIGSCIGPVAVLVQGQAWRWVWITVFIGAVLLPVTALHVWEDEKCGPLCVMLLVLGWTLPADDGTACVSLALIAWSMRAQFDARAVLCIRWLSVVLGAAILAWVLIKSWAIVAPASPAASQLREIFGLRIPAVLFGALVWWWLGSGRTAWAPRLLAVLLAAMSIFLVPAAFKQARTLASPSEISEFSAWIRAIPETSSVLVAPAQDVGAFVWFTLGRPNYLAVDQSAGVVFSRTTALEVQRRSQVLLPVMDPNWRILTKLRAGAARKRAPDTSIRPLTTEALVEICADPRLGFVVARQDVGFEPLTHEGSGAWKDWKLYDCRRARSRMPT